MSRGKLNLSKLTASMSCGGCMKSKVSDIFVPKLKPKSSALKHMQYARSKENTTESQPHYSYYESPNVGGSSYGRMAVEKDSNDPYLDFRDSMLQMILENEIYAKEDLRELLNCFLQLNSPYHHRIIIKAFTEIWNGVYTPRPGANSYSKSGVKRVRRKTRNTVPRG